MFDRLLIDCTHTIRFGFRTGVQRVVRSLCEQLADPSLSQELFKECVPVWQDRNLLRRVSPEGVDFDFDRSSLQLGTENDITQLFPPWYRKTLEAVVPRVPSRKVRSWLLPAPGHKGLYRHIGKLKKLQARRQLSIVEPQEGDLLLLPDAYWTYPQIWSTAGQARANGARIASVVYDLIPLTHAHIYDQAGVAQFKAYLTELLNNSDMRLTISSSVRDQLLELGSHYFPTFDRTLPTLPFRLGCEFSSTSSDSIRQKVQDLFRESTPTFLMVGTLETRKNHVMALRAMEALWQSGKDCSLVIAGALGWRGEEFLSIAEQHPEYGRRLHICHDFSDAEIQHSYKNCQAVLFPSLTEGFGLPIVEALHFKKPVIASDILIHREVGGALCNYFELDSVEQFSKCILDSFSTGRQQTDCLESNSDDLCLSWREAAQRLCKDIRETQVTLDCNSPARSGEVVAA